MDKEQKKRKKTCPHCGRNLWLRDFWKLKSGERYRLCIECGRKEKNEEYARNHKVPDGTFYHKSFGRIMEHKGCSTRIFWNKDMLDILKTHYPNTKNEEVAEMCGVSPRTMIRKARELGLQKDKDFVQGVWEENRKLMVLTNKVRRNSGMIQKGHIPWNKGLKLKETV